MGRECCVSFSDLFLLAKKRSWTTEEERHFQSLDQGKRNSAVKQLAREAGCIRAERWARLHGVLGSF